ncbi:ceramidase domain-containing protein [Maritimibacter alkaliphilus]|uniref:ceramidase domain-containing protein n=1 Tax=Maritimibacter alkaliphilus TaxID=404236 RepID=UPI001C955EB1|nr:ceramidase domain-containing protein [Maritimibacter alkaliphilus]MBY6090792.1 ceramidase [Maritimibacter alkaliphilus]
MDWTRAVDAYCERTGPDYWSEPVNALTNLAFLLSAAVMWRRCAGLATGRITGRVLCAILFVIGIGSWLFHTHAQAWAGMADTLPILVFILAYIFVANRDFWGMRPLYAALAVLAFFPFVALTLPLFRLIPGIGSSAGYAPVPLLIALYAIGLRGRAPELARNLALGAGLLVLSITFRALDGPLCTALPGGTHFLWHLMNALMLGWMIETWRRHRLAGAGRGR